MGMAASANLMLNFALIPNLHAESTFGELFIKVMIPAFYCGALLAAGVVTRRDLALFRNILSQRRRPGSAGSYSEAVNIQ
jgi:hypothetical protein